MVKNLYLIFLPAKEDVDEKEKKNTKKKTELEN